MREDAALAYFVFADLLEYPVAPALQKAEEALSRIAPEIAATVRKFIGFSASRSIQRIQELYTVTFDMQPVCYPYIGYHLYGESYKRGAFMAQLNETYRAVNFSAGLELPDHLPAILRFLGQSEENRSGEFGRALIGSGVIPALEKMLAVFGAESENPYCDLLSALKLFLERVSEKDLSHA